MREGNHRAHLQNKVAVFPLRTGMSLLCSSWKIVVEGAAVVCASVTGLWDTILQPVHLVFISRCTFKSIISAIDVILFIEVSDRTIMCLWWHTCISQAYTNKPSTVLSLCTSYWFYVLFLKVFRHFFCGFQLWASLGIFFAFSYAGPVSPGLQNHWLFPFIINILS